MPTVPLSGTNIYLLSGVPFSNDYKHSRWFDTLTDQQTYFNARTVVHSMTQANFQRIDGHTIIACNLSIDSLWGTNYLMFQNASYNDKWFYAFVTKLEYKNQNCTHVHFQIDVLQTWLKDFTFKPSFTVREHCTLYEADGTTPVINTIDEGLFYGSEYDTLTATQYHAVIDSDNHPIYFLVIVSKQTLHIPTGETTQVIKSTLNGLPQPLSYYIVPFYFDGSTPTVSINGGATTTLPAIQNLLTSIFTMSSSVNDIVSMYVTESIGQLLTVGSGTIDFPIGFKIVDASGTAATSMWAVYVSSSPGYVLGSINCGDIFSDFGTPTESKLLMHPYSLTILDDFKGNRIVLKPEYISPDSSDLIVDVYGSIAPTNKVAFVPRDYNEVSGTNTFLRALLAMEYAMINNDPQDLPILADELASFMQGNKNTINNQMNSIIFNGTMNGIGSLIGGIASASTGNVAGVASSITNIAQGAGNTVLQIQGIQAKIKDIDNLPPQLSKMGNSSAFSFGNNFSGFYVIKKQIKDEYKTKLSDFFNAYGYKMNEIKVPNLHTRINWNYVETRSCMLTGNFNNEDMQDLKRIFDNGITLWHTDDIGNYSLSNGVI